MVPSMKKCAKCLGTGFEQDQAELGHRMWKKRADACLSLAQVAHAMDIDPSYLSYLEAGKRDWSPDLIHRFEAAVNKL